MAKQVSDYIKTAQVNSFTGGLITDLHPLVQPNDTLTDCINGTLITYNGNENMLQNDLGNNSLLGAELPEGYIPLGMKEHNGVIYIVSQNPLTQKVQIGSYPSPELSEFTIDPREFECSPIDVSYSIDDMQDIENISYDILSKYFVNLDKYKSPISYFAKDDEDGLISFGDYYTISNFPTTSVFQKVQFVINANEDIKNIDLNTDGKEHVFNHLGSGYLGVKYTLDKPTEFDFDVQLTESNIETVNDIEKLNLTLKLKTTFNIDVHGVNKYYKGVSYTVYVNGDSEIAFVSYADNKSSLIKSYTIQCDLNPDIKVKAVPFIYTVENNRISQLLAFNDFIKTHQYTFDQLTVQNWSYKYYVENNIVNLYFEGAEIENPTYCLFSDPQCTDWSTLQIDKVGDANNAYKFTYPVTNEFIIVKLNELGIFPLFKSVDKTLYDRYINLQNFCSIPGDELEGNMFYKFDEASNIYVGAHKANDLIDITTLLSSDVYSNQNMYEYYGIFEQKQFECNNVDSIGKSSLYLQAYVNDRWYDVQTYDIAINNNNFKQEVLSGGLLNGYKESSNERIGFLGKKEYLLKHMCPIGFELNATLDSWKKYFQNRYQVSDAEWDAIYQYCNWQDSPLYIVTQGCGDRKNKKVWFHKTTLKDWWENPSQSYKTNIVYNQDDWYTFIKELPQLTGLFYFLNPCNNGHLEIRNKDCYIRRWQNGSCGATILPIWLSEHNLYLDDTDFESRWDYLLDVGISNYYIKDVVAITGGRGKLESTDEKITKYRLYSDNIYFITPTSIKNILSKIPCNNFDRKLNVMLPEYVSEWDVNATWTDYMQMNQILIEGNNVYNASGVATMFQLIKDKTDVKYIPDTNVLSSVIHTTLSPDTGIQLVYDSKKQVPNYTKELITRLRKWVKQL